MKFKPVLLSIPFHVATAGMTRTGTQGGTGQPLGFGLLVGGEQLLPQQEKIFFF
jgi:hypothetical protein